MASKQVSSAFRLASTDKLWGFVYKLEKHKSSNLILMLKVFLQYYFLKKNFYVVNFFFIYSNIYADLQIVFAGSLRTIHQERKM